MPTDILALPPSSLNTKWKEPYASASLNQRFVGITAPGIYRGLRLEPDPALGDRTIQVQADPDKADHVAVYENALGFSVTYRDSTSGDITLSLAGYASVDVVVCIFVDYQTGVSTTGAFRVFTVAEFNALPASTRNALVILGTITVPASGVIPSTNISLLRRTLASSNLSRGAIPSAPLIRNPGFESGETNATYAKSSLFWDKSMTVGTGTWKTSTAQVATGMKSIEVNVTAGPVTGEISQQVGVETAEGELFIVAVTLKQLKTISSGSFVFFMEWSDVNDAILSTTTLSLDGGIDAVFRTEEIIFAAPAGVSSLRSVGIRATALSPSTTGVFAYVDNVDVFVEPRDPRYPYAFDQAFRRDGIFPAVALADKSGNFASKIAQLRFDQATPTNEGRVYLERRDQDYSGGKLPPALALLGRFAELGSKLLGTEADALKARVTADTSVAGGVDFTLMWESARAGETTGTYTQPVVRIYASVDGQWCFTSNAIWGGATWTKDVAGQNASKYSMAKDGLRIQTRVSDTAWSDSAWASTFRLTNPLESAADARTSRVTMTGFDGAATTDFTLLFAVNFTGYVVRLYASYDLTNSISLQVTFNAQWNGTNWVKDTNGRVSARMTTAFEGATGAADVSRLHIEHQTCNTTDTFPESDWSASPTSTTIPNSGGDFYTGRVYAGPNRGNVNPQARLAASPDGFGDGITASTFFVDSMDTIETPNFKTDSFGNLDSSGGMIFEEFYNTSVPVGWSNFVSGAGAVNYNYEGVSRVRLNPGATDSAGIRTNGTIVQAAYSSFNAEVRWPNVLGKTQIGYEDVAANIYAGFLQDSATYGDENIRVALRTGAGLQIFDSGISLSPIVDDWVKLKAFARGGSGLLTTTSLFWSIQSKKGSASGVFTPGGSILNPTSGVYFRFNAQNGAFLVIERAGFGGHDNFAL